MSASINGILLIIVLLLLVVAIIAVSIGSRAGKSSSRTVTPSTSGGAASPATTTTTPTSPTPSTTGSGANPSAQAGGWKKLGWLILTAAIISGGIIGIYWSVQTIDQGMPERKEFTAYYQYAVEDPDGSIRQGDPALVKITPNEISSSFASSKGGRVTLRWVRGKDGCWTRISNRHTYGSWLRIKNMTSDPQTDFKEWQHKILGEIGDDTDPAKSYKISLTR